jgi:hypothetical protein
MSMSKKDKVKQLQTMMAGSDMSESVIVTVLDAQGGDLDKTLDELLTLAHDPEKERRDREARELRRRHEAEANLLAESKLGWCFLLFLWCAVAGVGVRLWVSVSLLCSPLGVWWFLSDFPLPALMLFAVCFVVVVVVVIVVVVVLLLVFPTSCSSSFLTRARALSLIPHT